MGPMLTTVSLVVYVMHPHTRPIRPSAIRIIPSVLFTEGSFRRCRQPNFHTNQIIFTATIDVAPRPILFNQKWAFDDWLGQYPFRKRIPRVFSNGYHRLTFLGQMTTGRYGGASENTRATLTMLLLAFSAAARNHGLLDGTRTLVPTKSDFAGQPVVQSLAP